MSWDGLVAAALLGTERRRPQADGDPMLAGIDWSDPEGALLAGAAVISTARAAGGLPPRVPSPEPAPEDEAPLCSPEADAVLARVLAEAPELLEEWLERVTAAGLRAWPRRLADLLSEATHDRGLRGLVVRAGGRRGGWLAGQSPDWSWATKDPADAEAWETGTRDERLAMLQVVRAQDPAAARALVESTWASDPPNDRAAFLRNLAPGLSLDDEALLERALDDGRKGVRDAAAEMLGRLPESAYGRRMAERLAPLIGLTGRLRKTLEVELPEGLDASMARDGISEKGGPRKLGARAWLLRQIVAAAPLRVWTDATGLTPRQVIDLAGPEIHDALRYAIAAQADPEWTLAPLPDARDVSGVFEVVAAVPGPWDFQTSHAVLDALDRAKVVQTHHWQRRGDVLPLARRLDPGLLERAAAVLAKHEGTGIAPDAVGEALAVLDLRHAIMRETT